jgi:hypothetical protein
MVGFPGAIGLIEGNDEGLCLEAPVALVEAAKDLGLPGVKLLVCTTLVTALDILRLGGLLVALSLRPGRKEWGVSLATCHGHLTTQACVIMIIMITQAYVGLGRIGD